ncbi:ankyrin [Xylaria arbuscula]|nr:ankyrin [Xylaria arbuscula]
MTIANNAAALQNAIATRDLQLANDILSSCSECVDYQVNGSVIARLVEWGADVNQAANKHWMGNTPLHIAASLEQTGPLHLLLLRGANVKATNLAGDMARDVAERYHHKANTILLVEFEGSTRSCFGIRSRILEFQMGDFVDRSGTFHLDAGAIWAVKKRRVALATYLLDIDPSLVNVYDEDFWDLLHHSAWNGDYTMAELLLNRGAQVNSCTKSRGCTPLHLAAQRGHQPIVTLILAKGGDLYTKTLRGSTARMLAIRGDHEYVVRTIDEHIRKDYPQNAKAQRRGVQPGIAKDKSRRRVSLDDYHLQERDEHDSSDEASKPDRYDGELSGIKPGFTDRQTFTSLIKAWKDWCQERKSYVKIAILDTGIDLKNTDLGLPRVEAFIRDQSGNLEIRLAEDETVAQTARVKGRLNLARQIQPDESDIQDLDGHGTRVAGIIMRLAPAADLYIARVCDGYHRSLHGTVRPTHGNVADAIEWAMEKKVDIINLSLGFSAPHQLRRIVEKAKESGILIIAAMSNTGNYGTAEDVQNWPAREFDEAIGIHSCKPKGTFPSEFTPPAIPGNPNFMVAGEAIVVHKFPYSVGVQLPAVTEWFELVAGMSYVTPVATCMAVLILTFVKQEVCQGLRREARKNGLNVNTLLKDHRHMAAVLRAVGKPTWGYLWISPELLWTGFRPPAGGKVAEASREYAWNIICRALKQDENSQHENSSL